MFPKCGPNEMLTAGPRFNRSAFPLSPLQLNILTAIAHAGRRLLTRELVEVCFPAVSRSDNRARYQSVFAAISRAITRLEERRLVARCYAERAGNFTRIALLPAGESVVKRVIEGDTFNRKNISLP
jgi:DNA-binding MarR family transcriptional regulator